MVCLGNICRSPLAEGILQSKLDANFFSVDSAGTAEYHIGELPDQRSIAVAKKHGIDISNQRARKFDVKNFIEFDVIYAMDKENYQNICSLAKKDVEIHKVKMILNEVNPSQNLSVPDPYYGGDHGFEIVFDKIEKACKNIIESWNK